MATGVRDLPTLQEASKAPAPETRQNAHRDNVERASKLGVFTVFTDIILEVHVRGV